jgi:hypothetical protein
MFLYDSSYESLSYEFALLESIRHDLEEDNRIECFVDPLTGAHEMPPLLERIVHFNIIQEIFEVSSNPGIYIVKEKAHEFWQFLNEKLCDGISTNQVVNSDY